MAILSDQDTKVLKAMTAENLGFIAETLGHNQENTGNPIAAIRDILFALPQERKKSFGISDIKKQPITEILT